MAPSSSALKQQEFVSQITLGEKLVLVPKVFGFILSTLTSLLTRPLTSQGPPTLKKHLAYAFVRSLTSSLTPHQQQYLNPGTDATYTSFCTAHSLQPDNEILPDGTRALWIGPRTARKVLVHFHGGGYVLPAAGYTFEYLFALREGLRASLPESTFSPEVPNEYLPSILVLSYDLSPGVKFPRQLEQANALLDHLLTVVKKSPADIILSGDSAGANLALALLSHIAHPHPSLPLSSFPSASGAKFAGAVLISPWVSFDYAGEKSVSTNAKSDDIGQEFLVKCTTSFLGKPGPWTGTSGPDNNYIEAAHAAGNWWRDVPVDSVLVTAGADEILLDGILKLAKGLREGIEGRGGRVEVLVAKGEAHESPFLDKALGEAAGESDKAIEAFVKAKL